ncbi:solute carrier family 22 member 7 [Aplysia californica]|uniref:Solute carrier family 22 member 7 n=1 Tax=Aplysia californica TaxID=6500 RepID=A0ABM1VRJ8_APLCA|nr:solute carrier family 22 member 7 [Aplysia californica]
MGQETKHDFEDILSRLGGFSKFQVLMIGSVFTMKFMMGWSMLQMSFAGLIPDWYCVLDDGGNRSVVERSLNSTFERCEVDGEVCQDFRFVESARTIITEWNLLCDLKWVKATVTSIQMSGVTIGCFLGGQMGDYFGRKKTTYGFALYHVIMNVITAYSVSWQMFAAMRFFVGIGIGALLVVIFPYPLEFLPLKWRPLLAVLPMWPLGSGMLAGAAWLLQDWSHLHLACAAFCAPGLIGWFFIPESVRWLTVHGKVKDAYKVLVKVAKVNGRELPDFTESVLVSIHKDELASRQSGRQYSYLDVFRGKRMAKITISFAILWFSLSFVFYGLSFGVSSLAGNIYLNMFLMAVVEIPAQLTTFYFNNKVGRRWTCLVLLAMSAVSAFACMAVNISDIEDKGTVTSGLSLAAKMAAAACWAAVQTWGTEIYPTVTRNLGYGVGNTAARLGGIVAPFAINLDDQVVMSYAIIGVLMVICLLLCLIIPETKGEVMADSLIAAPEVDDNSTTNDDYAVKKLSHVLDIDRVLVLPPDSEDKIPEKQMSIMNGCSISSTSDESESGVTECADDKMAGKTGDNKDEAAVKDDSQSEPGTVQPIKDVTLSSGQSKLPDNGGKGDAENLDGFSETPVLTERLYDDVTRAGHLSSKTPSTEDSVDIRDSPNSTKL